MILTHLHLFLELLAILLLVFLSFLLHSRLWNPPLILRSWELSAFKKESFKLSMLWLICFCWVVSSIILRFYSF